MIFEDKYMIAEVSALYKNLWYDSEMSVMGDEHIFHVSPNDILLFLLFINKELQKQYYHMPYF